MGVLILIYPSSYPYLRGSLNNYEWTTGDYVFLVIGLALLAFAVFYFFYRLYKKDESPTGWDAGIIPKDFEYNAPNVFELYIAAGAAMIVRDPVNFSGKVPRMASYLRTKMPQLYYEFSDSVSYSLKHVVKLDSLTAWVNEYFSPLERLDLANFMTFIAVCDGSLNDSEKAYLFALFRKLGVQMSDIDDGYQSFFTASQKEVIEVATKHRKSDYDVLGLETGASHDEIKRAYRSLVKMCHPDRFMHESEAVRSEMAKRFREIQQAYENLTK
jgi:DnaJ-domain-containing protein 1